MKVVWDAKHERIRCHSSAVGISATLGKHGKAFELHDIITGEGSLRGLSLIHYYSGKCDFRTAKIRWQQPHSIKRIRLYLRQKRSPRPHLHARIVRQAELFAPSIPSFPTRMSAAACNRYTSLGDEFYLSVSPSMDEEDNGSFVKMPVAELGRYSQREEE